MPQRWIVLLGLIGTRLAFGFHMQALAAVGPGVVVELGLSNAELGILIGIFMAPGVLLSLPSGAVAQRFGDRAVIGASLAIMTVGGLVAAFGTGYWTILVGRLLGGAGSVMITVSATKVVFDWFEGKEIATAMAAVLTGYPVRARRKG